MKDFNSIKRIVIKLGSAVLTKENGDLAEHRLFNLVHACSKMARSGKEIIIVSSGAVALGRKVLDVPRPLELVDKQACAALGQGMLMERYRRLFRAVDLNCAQVLVTARDFSERQSYLTLESVFKRLLDLKVIPIVNENDTVSTAELKEQAATKSFGDNDKLSALVAGKLDADLLIILSNVDGVFTDNPKTNPKATLIREISNFAEITGIETTGTSLVGRGGMQSKLEAARIASICGVDTIVASGLDENTLEQIAIAKTQKDCPGTYIHAIGNLAEKKQWIGLASGYKGIITVNEGAEKALTSKQASLLTIGITEIQGQFNSKDIVSIQNKNGKEIGRGITNLSSNELTSLMGQSGHLSVHRDNIVIFEELTHEEHA